jgi:hypothetical protein
VHILEDDRDDTHAADHEADTHYSESARVLASSGGHVTYWVRYQSAVRQWVCLGRRAKMGRQ